MPPTPPRAHAPHAQHGKKAGAVRGRARAEKKREGNGGKKRGGALPVPSLTWRRAPARHSPGQRRVCQHALVRGVKKTRGEKK